MDVCSRTTRARPRCTVRGCEQPLDLGERAWRCAAGHSFDVAHSGYVNLLQPQDRRSRRAGDAREAVLARERLARAGIGVALFDAIRSRMAELGFGRGHAVLDAGSGPGFLLSSLADALGIEGWGLDLSVPAIERAARADPRCRWIVANADRALPFEDGSFACVLSARGPKNWREFRRVLAATGRCLVAVPGPDDLVELRAELLGEGRALARAEAVLEATRGVLRCERREAVRERRRLGRSDLADLLRATYRGARRSREARLEALGEELEVTLSDELLVFAPP